MPATKWFSHDPEVGSPVVHEYADPAMADKVVHFVGRARGTQPVPYAVRHLTAEQRLAQILTDERLLGFPVYQSGVIPVVSVSDLSAAELETAFSRGLNSRRRLEPWALVLDRQMSWNAGFRPVVYADHERVDDIRAALSGVYGPKGAALGVRTELGRDDWTAEREWRFCFDAPPPHVVTVGLPPPPPPLPGALGIRNGVKAVIVGKSWWVPRLPEPVPTMVPPERWLWDETNRRLVHDGRMPLW